MNGLPVEMKTAETGAVKQVEKWLKNLNIKYLRRIRSWNL
jgi:hypothetical protein